MASGAACAAGTRSSGWTFGAGKLNGGGHVLAAGFNMQGCRLPQDRAKILGIVIAHYREFSAR